MVNKPVIKKAALSLALLAGAIGASFGVAHPAAAAGNGATVTHYTAQGFCDCFGEIDTTGVHLTNTAFAGADDGNGNASGGRDNFSGTVSSAPAQQVVLTGADGFWCSDYDSQLTSDWEWVINPDGTQYGWAIYSDSNPQYDPGCV